MLFGVWYGSYMGIYKANLKPRTKEEYNRLHSRYLRDLDGVELSELTPELLAGVLANARIAGSRTELAVFVLLRACLRRAVRSRVLDWSPMDALDRPSHRSKEGRALTPEQVASLEDIPLGVALGLYAGLRRGECCGLRWEDIDLPGGLIHVVRQRIRAGGELIITDPKSAAGKRDVPIAPELYTLLRKHWQFSGYIYPNTPEHLSRSSAAYLRRSLGERYHYHELRHTYLTRLVRAGVNPKVCQYIAGHADINTTMRVYTHITGSAALAELSRLALAAVT